MTDNRVERGQQEILRFSIQQAKRAAHNYLPQKGKVAIQEEIRLEEQAYKAFDVADKMIAEGISTGDVVNDYMFRRLGMQGLIDRGKYSELRNNIDRINHLLKGKTGEEVLVVDQIQYYSQKGYTVQLPRVENTSLMVARFSGAVLSGEELLFDPQKIRCKIPTDNTRAVKGIYELDTDDQDLLINPTVFSDFEDVRNGENMFIYVGRENVNAWVAGVPPHYSYYVKDQIARVLPKSS